MVAEPCIYRVVFLARDQQYEVFARRVSQGELFGFVSIEELLFGERSKVVVDPGEERLKTEFEGVRRFYVPLHAVVRIDEVAQQGVARVTPAPRGEGKVTPFPMQIAPKPDGGPSTT